ncbi:MAG TPA: VanW family protein [Patescibacteria group bacterium]|nr:VanW family protein [Patescibacteria group bacterium]
MLTKLVKNGTYLIGGGLVGIVIFASLLTYRFARSYDNRALPGIVVGDVAVSGMTREEIESLFREKSRPLADTMITLNAENQVATLSGAQLDIRFDGDLAARQAMLLGRTGNQTGDLVFRLRSFFYDRFPRIFPAALTKLPLTHAYRMDVMEETLDYLGERTDVLPLEPVFEFDQTTNRVTTFRLGKDGRRLDKDSAKHRIDEAVRTQEPATVDISLSVLSVAPKASAEDIGKLGIVELIGTGESYYTDSIPGRIHNLLLASSRISGVIVAPGEIFSFNEAVGDITAATGYKSAYIIKNGRTILGDGGGVCQASTTLFRAALNAGLDIVERYAHSFRVGYYEQGGFKPGLDATVYDPTADLKIKNNTKKHLLITTESVPKEYKLIYRIYGEKDGREVHLGDVQIGSQVPPPPPLYQEDPTMAAGEIKQVEHPAWGAKTTFNYKVTRGEEILTEKTFVSNYRAWQAVYLYGPGTAVPE